MAVLFTNNAQGVLNAGITAIATAIVLTAGGGAQFPSPTGSDFAMLTLFNAGGTYEIVKLTSRAADTLTVVRGQEGTAGFAFSAADKVDLRITAAGLANKLDKDTGGVIAGALTVNAVLTTNSTFSCAGAAAMAAISVTTIAASGLATLSGGVSTAALTASGTSTLAAANFSGLATMNAGLTVATGLLTISAGGNLTPAATPGTNAIGYLGVPQVTHAGNYTALMSDAGKEQYFTATATGTIPSNAAVALPIGSFMVWSVVAGQVLTVAINTDTLRFLTGNVTGSRTVTGPGYLIAQKKTATEWWASGQNVT